MLDRRQVAAIDGANRDAHGAALDMVKALDVVPDPLFAIPVALARMDIQGAATPITREIQTADSDRLDAAVHNPARPADQAGVM
jgi:hypothetical protein